MLSRIAQKSRQTISVTFDGGAAGDVTIGIVNQDGEEVVASGTATVATSGVISFEITPTISADLGRLRATWIDEDDVTVTSVHDVVGFHLITLAELRKFEPLDDEVLYTEEQLRYGRDMATYALERACNRALAPQLATETVTGRGGRALALKGGPTSLISIAQDAEALEADGILLDPAGFLERTAGAWVSGSSYEVSYIHGLEAVDPRVSRAVGLIASDVLFADQPDGQGSGIPERATSLSTADGTFSLVTAGMGNSFSLPEVNAVVQELRLPS